MFIVKLDTALVGRYLSLQDNEFAENVAEDIRFFVKKGKRRRTNQEERSSLPERESSASSQPLRSLCQVCEEETSRQLCTFSIGQGFNRRTVVCFEDHLISKPNGSKILEKLSSNLSDQNSGTMVVERQQNSSDSTSPEHQCKNGSAKKARTPTEIYRPPAARKLASIKSISGTSSPDFTTADVISVTSRNEKIRAGPKQRRPDIQVYVPRAKRCSLLEQDTSERSSLKSDSVSLQFPSLEPKRNLSGMQCKALSSAVDSGDDNSRFPRGVKLSKNAMEEHVKENKDDFGILIPGSENSEICDQKAKELSMKEVVDMRSACCIDFQNHTEESYKSQPVQSLYTAQANASHPRESVKNSEVSLTPSNCSFSVSDKLYTCDEMSVQCENQKLNQCCRSGQYTQEDSSACEQQVVDSSEDECCSNTLDTCNSGCKNKEKQNKTNNNVLQGDFVSDVFIISDPESIEPHATCISKEDQGVKLQPNTKKKKMQNQTNASSEGESTSPLNIVSSLNPDECTWDMLFDDNGDYLDPKMMEELTNAVGSVTIEKPKTSYKHYVTKSEINLPDGDSEFGHVVEIYNFPSEFKTQDLLAIFAPYKNGGFEIKWVDDTHALGVFSSSKVAADVLAYDHPFVKTRPLADATSESRLKARRSAEFLQPYRARPETCAALARRLVTGALGVKLATAREEREAERRQLREAREKKRLAARQQQDAWEGTIAEKQTTS